MDARLSDAINEQINKELFSSYMYMAMAAYCDAQGLEGFSHWMKMQAQEEMFHAMKFYDYMNDCGERVIMRAIAEPDNDYEGPRDIIEKTLAHEKTVTASINNLYSIAEGVNDNAAKIMLQWFISEQVEEEKNVGDVLNKYDMFDGHPAGLYMLDQELQSRPAPTAPAAE